jgi:hypothetical protein
VEGIPNPFGSWDAYYLHKVTLENGAQFTQRTNDFNFPLVKKLVGYKHEHPQEGDSYLIGGVFGGQWGFR